MEDSLHREILEEHARSPSHRASLDQPTGESVWKSSKTGNACSLTISVSDTGIDAIQATVEGSALAVACASLMGAAVESLSEAEAFALAHSVIAFLERGKKVALPGDLIVYESIVRFPERHDCAMLAWRALLVVLES